MVSLLFLSRIINGLLKKFCCYIRIRSLEGFSYSAMIDMLLLLIRLNDKLFIGGYCAYTIDAAIASFW